MRPALESLGLGPPRSWLETIGLAVGWLVLMLGYSPVADRLATRWIARPPTLGVFRPLQRSKLALAGGILAAWALGGFLEELVFRGIVLREIESWLAPWLAAPLATTAAICGAALGAGLLHFYQGPRAMVIVTQLSALFGLLFVLCGYELWTVILCHGLYDTVAFVRFANRSSRYSNLDSGAAPRDGEH